MVEFATDVRGPVLIVLLGAVLVALVLSRSVAQARLARHRWLYGLFALPVAAGLGWLLLYAAGNDPYYHPVTVSRWEHASRNGLTSSVVISPFFVVFAVAISLVSITGLLVVASSAGHARLRRVVMPVVALAYAALVVAYFPLTGGH